MQEMKTFSVLRAIPALVLSAAAACGGGGAPSAADPSVQRFAVSLQGEDIGYMEIRLEPIGEDSLLLTEETMWDLVLMGNRRQVVMTLEARTDSTLDLGSLDFSLSDGQATISSRTVRTGGTLTTVLSSAGREMTSSAEFEGDYLPAVVDLACAGMAWTEGQERIFPSFDPASGTVDRAEVTCLGLADAVLLGDTVPAVRLEIRQLGTTTEVWVSEGQILSEEDPGLGMLMTRVPPGQGGDVYSSRDLYQVFAVSSTPVSNPRTLGKRVFRLEGDVDWSRFQLSYPPVQTASGTVVSITAQIPDTVAPFPVPAEDWMLPWLEDDPMIQSSDPSVKNLADSLTTGASDAWEAACAISRFVDAYVENTPTVSLPSSVEVLESARGDCNEHTVLFAALARAAGIPARVCAGIVYLSGSFGYHAWPLVWVGEWVPMDPTFGQTVADPTHVILAEGSLESQYVITSVMGRLHVTELGAETDD